MYARHPAVRRPEGPPYDEFLTRDLPSPCARCEVCVTYEQNTAVRCLYLSAVASFTCCASATECPCGERTLSVRVSEFRDYSY